MPESASQESARREKRPGAWLGLYDSPVLRDWLFYWTLFWAAFTGYAISTTGADPDRQSTLPVWLDVLFAALLGAFILGILPACLRRVLRAVFQHAAKYRSSKRLGASSSYAAEEDSGDTNKMSKRKNEEQEQLPTSKSGPDHRSARPVVESRPVIDLLPLDGASISDSARSGYPYPIARAARALQIASEPRERYEAILKTAEATCIVLGSTAAAWARREGVTDEALTQLQKALLNQGASQGHWLEVARAMQHPMTLSSVGIPGMAESLRLKKGGAGVVADLNKLISERNHWAHGRGPRTTGEFIERLRDLSPLIERVLHELRFFEESPWIFAKDSRLRRREKDFHIEAFRAMGDHPDFDMMSFYANRPLANDNFYLVTRQKPIDLTPFIVMRPCPTCHQLEVAHADRLDPAKGLLLKTFDRGHVFFDKILVEEVKEMASSAQQKQIKS